MKKHIYTLTQTIARLSRAKSFLLLLLLLGSFVNSGWGQTISWTNSGGLTAWYTNTYWTPNTASGAWTTANLAQFNNTGSATTAGINMATARLSIGAIEVSSSRTRALTIGNSSGTSGTLTFNGITVNSIANTILRNASNSLLTLQNNETGTGKTMNIALANATTNTINIEGTGGISISSIISGTSRSITKVGSGTGALTLSGANTFSGGTTLSAGTLNINNAAALGTGRFTISGGTINNTSGLAIITSTNNLQTWNSNFTFTGGNSLYLGTGAVTLTADNTVTVTASTLTVDGIIDGAFGITKAGAGTLALGGVNTYTGKTIINAGVINVTAENGLGAYPTNFVADQLTLNGGTLAATGSFTFGIAGNNRGVTLGPSGGTFNVENSRSVGLANVVAGSGAFTKGSDGTLEMRAANTYTGLTTVSAGTLQLNREGGTTIPTTNSVTVNGGGTFRVSSNQTLNNLTIASGATLTIDAGVILTIDGTLNNSSFYITNGGTIVINGAFTNNTSITNTGTLTVNSSGTFSTSSTYTNTGTTTINGSFQLNAFGGATGAGSFTYGSTGTLAFNNTSSHGVANGDVFWPTSSGPFNVTILQGGLTLTSGANRTVAGVFQTAAGVTLTGATLTLNGTCQINTGGFFNNAPTYGPASTLIYNTGSVVGSPYGRNNEWSATSGAGYPNNVTLSNNTFVNLGANGGTGTARQCAGTLTIGSGSGLFMDFSTNDMTQPLTVLGDVIQNGSLSLSDASGGDLVIRGNYTRTGVFSSKSRAVFFNAASGNQTITGVTSFDFMVVNKTAGDVVLANDITVNSLLNLTSGKLAIGGNTLTLNGTVSNMSAANSLSTTTSSSISIGGTGTLGTLFFDASNNSLNNLTINRTSSGLVTLGNTLNVSGVVTPTAGQLATGGNLVLVSTNETGSGAIGNASANISFANNYITGNVTMQRYTRAQRGYRTFGHPFTTAQNLGILTDNFRITGLTTNVGNGTYATSAGNPSAFLYDPTQVAGTTSVLTRLTDATANVWERGKGLYVFVRGSGNEGANGTGAANYSGGHSPLTIDGLGAINQGDVTVNLGYGGVGKDNYNLIGNPYPCPINLKTVTNIGSYGTVYVYNPIKNTAGADQYTLSGGFDQYTNNGSNNIIVPAFGAFYIQATGDGQSLTFKESDKAVSGSPNFTVFGTDEQPKIRLAVANTKGIIDNVTFGIKNGSTDASTDKFDAAKLSNSLFNFYSITSDRKSLAIDYRANFSSIIPLGIQTSLNNTYSISLSELTDLPNTQVVLRDKLLKTETILSQVGDSYSFAITADTATKGENRFEIGLLGTTVLPVQIADITAQLQANKTVAVNWTSTTEVNLASYKVQRSKDGNNFTTVGTVAAKGASTYSYSDDLSSINSQLSTVYYRLEAVDKDGSKTYSKVVSCQLSVVSTSMSIYPNPVQSTLYAQVTVSKAGAAQLRVVDAQGKVVATQKTQLAVGTTSISIPAAQLSAGNYVLEIESADGKQTQRFVKE